MLRMNTMAMTMMVVMVINVYDDDAGVYGDACNDDDLPILLLPPHLLPVPHDNDDENDVAGVHDDAHFPVLLLPPHLLPVPHLTRLLRRRLLLNHF